MDNKQRILHKTSETHNQHDFSQESPNGDDLDSQILIPTGEEEQKQIPPSEKVGNTFNGTDARKSFDDYLFCIIKDLPAFKTRHGFTFGKYAGSNCRT
jgi:hypothetical protein